MNDQIDHPLVSIVLTTYNSSHCISKTINSLLDQTFKNFELIIIDDCSKDNTTEIVKSFSDSRICFIQNEKNLGVSQSRNKAMALAKGRYIVPSDHDDISLPEKIEKQVSFLELSPDTVLLATEAKIFVHGEYYKYHTFQKWPSYLLHWMLYFKSPIVHSSICFRKETLNQYQLQYHPEIKYADDYDLFHQFAHVGTIAILNEELVIKYEDGDNASFAHYDEMTYNGQGILLDKYINNLGLSVKRNDMEMLWRIINEGKSAKNVNELKALGELIVSASTAYCKQYEIKEDDQKVIALYNSEVWLRAVLNLAKSKGDLGILQCYSDFKEISTIPIGLLNYTKIIIASVIGKDALIKLKMLLKR